MRNLVLVVHLSLDGFVAAPDGSLDWFDPAEDALQFVCDLTEQADAAVFGRRSYQLLEAYWPTAKDHPEATPGQRRYSLWYNNAQKIVVSRTIKQSLPDTEIIHDKVVDRFRELKSGQGKDMLLFGSPSIAQLLMQADLIDKYWVFVNPKLFGRGILLFSALSQKLDLKTGHTVQFANGETVIGFERYPR